MTMADDKSEHAENLLNRSCSTGEKDVALGYLIYF